ncbi:MAG: DEAD/DEAH box helicase [Nitrosotalea sp.]
MLVDVEEGHIKIDPGQTALKTDQKLQLGFWNFRKVQNDFVSGEIKQLGEVIEYLKKENISFNLSDSVQKYLYETQNTEKMHTLLTTAAMNFKKGKFDKSDFNEFTESLNSALNRRLKGHQVKAAYHLSLIQNGANFSVPGSGKTSVVLAYFHKLRQEMKVNTLFVVGPPACFFPWRDEYQEVFGHKPRTKILSGLQKNARIFTYSDTSKPSDIYLVTFQTLLNDSEYISDFLRNPNINALLVIDEAHYMKRLDGNWANAVLNIARAAPYRCALTGTPIPRSYTDLYNLVEFLWPDKNPLNPSDKARLQIFEENRDFNNASKLLDPKIGPLFYRVRKKDLGLKPQVFHKPTLVKMNTNERVIYDAIVNKIRSYSQGDYLKNIDLVMKLRRGRMIRARQSLSYPRLLISALDDYKEDLLEEESDLKKLLIDYDDLEKPAKIETLLSMVSALQNKGQKVVIWSNFLGTIDLILNELTTKGYYCKKITGSVPIERERFTIEETREKIRDEFVDPTSGLDILIANPAACAESISLHKTCHHAIYYDLSYNLAQYLQSLDRIHRVGASEKYPAYYDFLLYENTIDEDILTSLRTKAEKMYQLIDRDYRIYSLDMAEVNEDEEAYERIFDNK